MMGSLWRTKSVEALTVEPSEAPDSLRRALGPLDLTTLGVGAIIGVGIFVLTGQAAAAYAGPGIVLSFLLAGIASAFAALCYAEMATMIPVSGSAYTYAYATMGELIAWMVGWDLILEYSLAPALVSVGWSGYVVSFLNDFHIHFPKELAEPPLIYDAIHHAWRSSGATLNLPAALIIAAATALLLLGIRQSAAVNTIVVLVKVFVVLTFIVVGAFFLHPANWHPFVPENKGRFGQFGWSGVLRGASVVFLAYVGFDAITTAAQETRKPQHAIPIGVIASLTICALLYVLVALVLTALVPYSQLNVPDPMAVGIDATGLSWMKPLIKIGAIAGLSTVVLVMILGQTRVFWVMAGDGLLPQWMTKIHSRFRTPYITTIATGALLMLVAAFFPIDVIAELMSLGTLLVFVIVCAMVLILRYRVPGIARPFRTPWVPLIPILGMLSCLYLMCGLPLETWIRLLVWLLVGVAIYFGYGRKHSRVANGGEVNTAGARRGS